MDFVEICKVCDRRKIIKAAKKITNSDKMCRSYSDLNFGVTFLEHCVDNKHVHCVPKKRHPFYFLNNSVKN